MASSWPDRAAAFGAFLNSSFRGFSDMPKIQRISGLLRLVFLTSTDLMISPKNRQRMRQRSQRQRWTFIDFTLEVHHTEQST